MAPTFSTTFSIQDMLRDTTKKFFPLTIALKIMLIRRRNTNLKKSSNKTKMPLQSCTMKSSLNLLLQILLHKLPLLLQNVQIGRMIARAFKAVVKGNWKWPRNFHEAMAAEDSEY